MNSRLRGFFLALMIGALLGAQIGIKLHDADLDAHAGTDNCEVCLHNGALGHGLLAKGLVSPPPAPDAVAHARVCAQAVFPNTRPQARGPPLALV